MKTQISTLLKELEKTRETFWNITPEVGQFLNDLIRENNLQTGLEIGSSNGYSGIWLAEAFGHNGGTLYTLESNLKKRYPLAQENFQKSGLTNIVQILGHAPEDLPKTPPLFDFAFFDATKHEHLSYFQALEKRINSGGFIITDNIDSHHEILTPYIKHLQSLPNWKSEEISLGTGLLISKFTPECPNPNL
jgi:predicted O-methyltransferase YrrM